ncbi:hypothetical protein [Legionella drancourtii]|uniref:Uncharacterized protein n=1 Tax=Legionella drancourtii LLAP12 TaxID=658187 RepID=G9EQA1_9GAMM|nr:hypothetical protein [Legionella drancourtii]EHL30496.1 hypothetical protein LDG_7448 [Legionella drancourtii LLAP12]
MSFNKYHQLIESSYSKDHAMKFMDNILNNEQADIIQQSCKDIQKMLPPQPFACALLSATLVEFCRIKGIHAYLVAGTLHFNGKLLFNYDPIIETDNMVDNWNGHCWVIFNNTIAEISLFRTAYSDQSPVWLGEMITDTFGSNRGALLESMNEMEQFGLLYTPQYVFSDQHISGLLNTVEMMVSKIHNIPLDPTTSRVASPIPGFPYAIF